MGNRKVNHHYISKFYLEGFCSDEGLIWTYDKENPKREIVGKPENTAFIKGLYQLENYPGRKHMVIEDSFAEIIEGPAAEPFKGLRSKKFPNFDEKQRLSILFGFQMVRMPYYMKKTDDDIQENLRQYSKTRALDKESYHENFRKFDPNLSYSEIEETRLFELGDKIEIKVSKDLKYINMPIEAGRIAEYLCRLSWVLVEAKDADFFILSKAIKFAISAKTVCNKFTA